jgi:hypothetical protein
MAYTVTLDDRNIGVIIFNQGLTKFVHYANRKGRPDTWEIHGCPRTADKFQTEKVERRKNDEAPPPSPAYMNQPMPR